MCDFSNIELLKQATIYSAKIIGYDDLIKTIKVGKLADMIIVEGNPVEDITAMYKQVVNVIRDGKVLI